MILPKKRDSSSRFCGWPRVTKMKGLSGPQKERIMKASRFCLRGAIVLLAIGPVNMVAAQKWVPRSDAARQELDSLTAEASPGTASAPIGPNSPPSLAIQEFPTQAQVRGWKWVASPTVGKWAKVKNRMSRVAVSLTRAAQDAGYLPPPTMNRSQTTSLPIGSARSEPASPVITPPPVALPGSRGRSISWDFSSGEEQCQVGRPQK
jgi:hypothetical protein